MNNELLFKYKIIVDMYETKSESRREWEFEAPMMSSLKGVGDELIITYGELKLRKRIGITKYNKYYLMQDPVETMLELTAVKNPVKNFEDTVVLFNGVNYISVEGVNGEIFLKYIVNSPFTDGLMTKTDLRSEIRVLEQEISMKVSKNDIISEINLTPGTAKISADKIALEGYTTINNGFSVDLQGNMTCKNATINGGLVVQDGLYSLMTFEHRKSEVIGGTSGGYNQAGTYATSSVFYRMPVFIFYNIPENFTVDRAEIFFEHKSANWRYPLKSMTEETYVEVKDGRMKNVSVYLKNLEDLSSGLNFDYFISANNKSYENYIGSRINNVWEDGTTSKTFPLGVTQTWTRDISNEVSQFRNGIIAIAPRTPLSYTAPSETSPFEPPDIVFKDSGIVIAKLFVYGILRKGG